MKIIKAEFAGSSTRVGQKPAQKLPEFAFIGRSNVGKSSLINMLTGNSKLAKTSQTPGKTQLVNHFLINDKWYLVDLPGYGYAKLPDKDRARLRHIIWDYINNSEELIMLFVLLDSRHDMQDVDLRFISELGEKGIPFGLIFTKADKQGPETLNAQVLKNKERLLEVSRFSDGEFQPYFAESVRGATCFIIQSTFPTADNLMELLLVIDAAKRASANRVIAVIPYYGWARQDRKDKPRTSIGAKLVANMLKVAGADAVMTCDLHADQIQGFFDMPVNHLYASYDFLNILEKMAKEFPDTLTLAAPDMGGAKRVNAYAKKLHTPVVICHKTRAKANVIEKIVPIGEVEGRDIVIIDDIIDTAGTLTEAANELLKRGARSVRAFATHPVLSGPAYERIDKSALSEVYVTDTIPLDPSKKAFQSKFRVVSLAETFARMILRVYNYQPISSEFPL